MIEKITNQDEYVTDDDILVEMQDSEGNYYYYIDEMRITVNGENYAFLVAVEDEEENSHCHDENCECGEDCDCGKVIIAKVVKDEDGEDIYIEPTDEEFDMVQEEYFNIMDEQDEY